MFAYCENNPVNGKDPNGDSMLAIITAGALGGILAEYGARVAKNLICGMSLGEAMTTNIGTIGDYAAAAFSGAVTAMPGGGLAAAAIDVIGSAVVKYSVDTLTGQTSTTDKTIWEATKNVLQTGGQNQATKSVPRNVRDVKPTAKKYGIVNRKLKSFYKVSVAATKTLNWVKRSAIRVVFKLVK